MDGEPSRGGNPRFDRLDDDYTTWSVYCQAYLQDRGVWFTVVTPRPARRVLPPGAAADVVRAAEDEVTKAAANWDRKNEIALSNIRLAVKPHLLSLVTGCNTATEAWGNLKALFEDDTTSRRAELEMDLSVLTLQHGESVIKYVGRAKGLRDALATAGVRVDEHSLVLHILRGLPSGYGTIRTVLQNVGGQLRLAVVTAKLLNVEKEVAAEGGDHATTKSQAFITSGDKRRQPTGSSAGGTSLSEPMTCYYCDKPGHFKRECRKRAADRARGQRKREGGGSGRQGGDRKSLAFVAKAEPAGNADGQDGCPDSTTGRTEGKPEPWLVDSGATDHMTAGSRDFVASGTKGKASVTLATGVDTPSTATGVATVNVDHKGKSAVISLNDTLLVPGLEQNLLSVPGVDLSGGGAIFVDRGCYLFQDGEVIKSSGLLEKAEATGSMDGRRRYMMGGAERPGANAVSAPVSGSAVLLHRRFLHLGYDNLRKAAGMVKGVNAKDLTAERVAGAVCRPCVEGKLTRAPFPKSDTKADLMELVHSDVSGPFCKSVGGSRHFATLFEQKTGITVAVPIANKSDVSMAIRGNVPELERLSGKRLQRLRTDGAKEYDTKRLAAWYADRGVKHESTLPYSPESNGTAERVNRTIKERARSAMSDAGAPEEMWAEAVAASVYVMNRSPRAGQDKTPWEALTGEQPDVSNLRVWGSLAYALKPAKQQKGMQSKTEVGIMVGYSQGGLGYRIYRPSTGEIVERRDVVMDETKSGWPKGENRNEWGADAAADHGNGHQLPTPAVTPTLTPSSSGESRGEGSSGHDLEAAIDAARRLAQLHRGSSDSDEEDEVEERYPGRSRAPPARYGQDGGGGARACVVDASTVEGEHKDNLPPPPKNVEEAKERQDWPLWRVALTREENSMRENEVWRKKKAPKGVKPIKAQVLFDYKFNQAGSLRRRKCRIVGAGCKQRPGRDFFETSASVPAAATTRTFLATAAARGWHVHHMDIKTAYLNAPMDAEVYIKIPEGFDDAGEEALLLKAMYGTKQAGHLWQEHLGTTLKSEGAVQADADPCVYVMVLDGHVVRIEVYVDDLIIAGGDLEAVKKVKEIVGKHYTVRDLGRVNDFTGMDVKWDDAVGAVTLSNPRHTAALLADYGMENAKPNRTPMQKGTVMGEGDPLGAGNRYAELVGSLMYLANQTRPDIAFATARLARRMAKPTTGDMTAAKAVLRYLKGTATMGLRYAKGGGLEGWVDADWAGDPADRKSTTGFVFKIHGGPLAWRSRLQSLVTTSTADAEFVAASEAAKESAWLRRVVWLMGEGDKVVTLKEDNQACVAMATGKVLTGRSKHVDVRKHMVRDYVKRGEVVLEYVPTEEQLADGFTKPLEGAKFVHFREAIGVSEVGGPREE